MAKIQKNDELYAMRHSLAHIMAGAIKRLWPDTRFGVGPVIDDGWYYDVEPGTTLTEDDLPKIEAEMKKIIEADYPFEKSTMIIDEALTWAHEHNQDFKEELLGDLKSRGTTLLNDIDSEQAGVEDSSDGVTEVSFYTSGDFMDLCRGPHVESTGKVGAFKLHKVAGAYWRGNAANRQMQRVYGWGFKTQEALDEHMHLMEEAKQRDHRLLGQNLDLYTSSELVGSGLPLFTPRGTTLRELLGAYSQQLRADIGFERIWTPHMTKSDLYKKSGHWDKFGDELFLVKSQETSDELVLKPMNCPHHTQVYASAQRSYRDLPIRFMENTTDYRDEKSGELHGLSRVRSLTQDDSHVFCTYEQAEAEITNLIKAAQTMYDTLDMELKFRLSFRDDSDDYLGEMKLWDSAQDILKKVASDNKLDFYIEEGEAAFYGPKIDYIAIDALGREWQVATVQLDFIQPGRFELEYTAEDGSLKQPVMIHCALLGSIERFLSVYIEHTAGHFPFWLAPEQIRILTVNDAVADYLTEVEAILKDLVLMEPLKYNQLRYSLDTRNESLGKKIREAESYKVPLIMIIGPKDKEAGEVSVRVQAQESKIKLDGLKEHILGL